MALKRKKGHVFWVAFVQYLAHIFMITLSNAHACAAANIGQHIQTHTHETDHSTYHVQNSEKHSRLLALPTKVFFLQFAIVPLHFDRGLWLHASSLSSSRGVLSPCGFLLAILKETMVLRKLYLIIDIDLSSQDFTGVQVWEFVAWIIGY